MPRNYSRAAQDKLALISIQISMEDARKLIWENPERNLIDFYINLIYKWTPLDLIWKSPESPIENERILIWSSPGQDLIDFRSNFNSQWNETGLGQSRTESDWFLLKLQWKIKGNESGRTQDGIWLISIQISIGKARWLIWSSPESKQLYKFQLKMKEINLDTWVHMIRRPVYLLEALPIWHN